MGEAADTLNEALSRLWADLVALAPKLLAGLVAFLALVLISRVFAAIVKRGAARTRLNSNLPLLLARLTSFLGTVLGLLVAAVIIFPTFNPGDLVAGLGITSIALGFAFKDILQNFLAGILILWRQPFHIGDEIRIGDYEGVVEEINTRSTRIKTYDGERAILPNGDVYTQVILVRTAYEARRVKFVVGIGYGDSIEEARSAIGSVLRSTDGVLNEPEPWVQVVELAPSSVNLAVYFWVRPKQSNLLKIRDTVATSIKLALDEAGIEVPYPHSVVLLEDARGEDEAPR